MSSVLSFVGVIAASACGAEGFFVITLAASFVLSCGLAIPAVLERIARHAARLPLAWRIAGRDASRMRERFTPAISAAGASIAVGIALATLLLSIDAHTDGATSPADRGVLDLLLALCACAAIATTQIATGLCAMESEVDARVLISIGAEPSVVRAYFAASAGHLALVAVALAIPAGVVAAMGVLAIANAPLVLRLPWFEIGVASIGVPSLAYFVRWLRVDVSSLGRAGVPRG